MEPTHSSPSTASTVLLKCALTLMLVSTLMIGQSCADCNRQPLAHTITHAGCIPKKVPSFGCRGTCMSYSRVSPTDYTRMERSCQCCQEDSHVMRVVRMNCRRPVPHVRAMEVKMAGSCSCRPCHGSSGVADVARLEDHRD